MKLYDFVRNGLSLNEAVDAVCAEYTLEAIALAEFHMSRVDSILGTSMLSVEARRKRLGNELNHPWRMT